MAKKIRNCVVCIRKFGAAVPKHCTSPTCNWCAHCYACKLAECNR